jgi:hypothetical protein
MAWSARTLIVGGGIWGLSTAYHLAQAGHVDICVLERNEKLFNETTSQAAGLVGQIRSTSLMREAIRYAIDLFSRFEQHRGHDPGFCQVAACLSPQRLQNRTPRHLNPRCRQTVVKDADRRFRLVRHYYVLPAKPRKNKEPTSGLEPLTCSSRVGHYRVRAALPPWHKPMDKSVSSSTGNQSKSP